MSTKTRNLFDEICEGFEALQAESEGKMTLRRHSVESKPVRELCSVELVKVRTDLNMSQGVFAKHLRVKKKTLQNWEQGRGKPNDQAALLVRMVARFPDTIQRLELVG